MQIIWIVYNIVTITNLMQSKTKLKEIFFQDLDANKYSSHLQILFHLYSS